MLMVVIAVMIVVVFAIVMLERAVAAAAAPANPCLCAMIATAQTIEFGVTAGVTLVAMPTLRAFAEKIAVGVAHTSRAKADECNDEQDECFWRHSSVQLMGGIRS